MSELFLIKCFRNKKVILAICVLPSDFQCNHFKFVSSFHLMINSYIDSGVLVPVRALSKHTLAPINRYYSLLFYSNSVSVQKRIL